MDTICRAVTFPIVDCVGAEWKDLMASLHTMWRASTALANWAVCELAKNDIRRKEADKKLGKMPPLYLYGHAKKKFHGWKSWQSAYVCASTLLRKVERKYRQSRFAIVWRGDEVLPTFRYPYPYPVHNQAWEPLWYDGRPAIRFNLDGKGWTLRLKDGAEFRRQIGMFRQMLGSDPVKRGELSIHRKGKHVLAKLIAHFPKPEAKSGHTILVRTDPNAFWVCERDGNREWILNADDVRRSVEAHRCFLQRISEDGKAERRSGGTLGRNTEKARQLRCDKQNNRLDSKTHEFTAMLVKFAQRQGAGIVIYDDGCRDYLANFVWHSIKTKLAYKLEAAGIQFVHQGGDDSAAQKEAEPCPTIQQAAETVRMVGRLARNRNRDPSVSHAAVSVPPPKSNGSHARRQRTS